MTARRALAALLPILACLPGCLSVQGDSDEERLQYALQKEQELMGRLDRKDRDLLEQVLGGYGHATFFYRFFKLPLIPFLGVGGGTGYGVVTDHRTNKSKVMSYTRYEWGWGTTLPSGASLVLAFKTKEAFEQFLDGGWDFDSGAQATAAVGGEGVDVGGSTSALESDVVAVELIGTGAGVGITVRALRFKPQ